jgi:hypothetical protein
MIDDFGVRGRQKPEPCLEYFVEVMMARRCDVSQSESWSNVKTYRPFARGARGASVNFDS